jgi:hypothetical protein
MLKFLLDRLAIRPFERRYDYDAGYLRALLAASPASFLKFGLLTGLTPRQAAPAELLAAAGLVGVLREDCGPCTQIGVDMALENRVKRETLRAVLAGDRAAMGETARLGYDFARASLDRRLEAADTLRDEIARRFGERAVAAVALTIMTSRMYPTLKYALGYGKTCAKVTVAGEAVRFERPELIAA